MGRSSIAMALALVVLAFIEEGEAVTYYVVGDGRGWTAPPNITAGFYDDWAGNKTFDGGDVLDFSWNGTHSLAAVSKEEYDSCAKVSSIAEGANGGGYGYKLPAKAGMYYFICTVDSHCHAGQKLAINVTSTTSAGFAALPPSTVGALWTAASTLALFLWSR